MIPMLRSLFAHQAWADIAVLDTVRAHNGAYEDEELRKNLHHILVVQRFFIQHMLGKSFDATTEMAIPATLDELVDRFHQAQAMQSAFINLLDDDELSRVLEIPQLKDIHPTVSEALMQVAMHSQAHRGQCLRRLRILGATPPTVDFIIWLKHKPVPDDRKE